MVVDANILSHYEYVSSEMEPMGVSAPPFLAPREIMETLEMQDPISAIETSSSARSSARSMEQSSGDEFLSMLKQAMPPGGVGGAPWSFTGPTGELMGWTENRSATYLTSGHACLDFFFQVVPDTPDETVVQLLERAWKEDNLTALKLMFHLRGVRGTGKSDKERFYPAAIWLHEKHPLTLRHNLAIVAEFGYFKDILEVLLRILEGPEVQSTKVEAKKRHKEVLKRGKENSERWNSIERLNKLRSKMKRLKVTHSEQAESPEASDSDDSEYDGIRTLNPRLPMPRPPPLPLPGMMGRNPRLRMPRPPPGPRQALMFGSNPRKKKGYYGRKGAHAREAKAAGTLRPREERVAASVEADQAAKKTAATKRKEKRLQFARRVAQRFYRDDQFQALYLETAKVFASQLKQDLKALHEDRLLKLSLVAKWTPSLDSSYDLRTLLCYAIATQLFPKDALPEYESVENQRYGILVRERLRKEVLVPLRKVLELPEVYMSARRWGDVNYGRVSSVAMTNYKEHFLKHDGERFNKFLEDVKSGRARIAAGALLPHEILKGAVHDFNESAEVAELQWKRMVQDLKELGSLSNCMAICDVSGSMYGEPIDVCIALGILLSDLCEEPWKGHVITFSAYPEIHLIAGESLQEKYAFSRTMQWGTNTNLQLVFEKLLAMAQRSKLAPEKMIKRLFIFSDMEFDQASRSPWETDYYVICKRFRKAGYGTPPQIVFWNLRNSSSIPVMKSQVGVAMVSGFSKNILKVFLENDGVIDPMSVMNAAFKGKEYEKLAVVD